jgi:nucleotide-binding universal stress UspA family protein
MYDHIVIPVDGSDEAKRAARRGLDLARDVDATVDVLHVVEDRTLGLAKGPEEEGRVRERGEAVLAELEAIASERDQSITTRLLEGKPSVEIRKFVRDRDAALIVIGTRGPTNVGKRLLGGVTQKLLQRSGVPVLVVPPGAESYEADGEYDRILLPTDGSENAHLATEHGIGLARTYESTVHVLNVVDLQAEGGVFDAGGLETEFVERLEARGQAAVDTVVEEIEDAAPDRPVKSAVVRTASFDGAAAAIAEYVTEHDVDLVVMGSRGRSNLQRHLLGSVSSAVLRTVTVPVLIVRPDA